jgi:hypothetical protein
VRTDISVLMIKGKSPIKLILSNWYILRNSKNLDIIDIVSSVEAALSKMADSKELDETDFMILWNYQQGYNAEEISRLTKISRQTVSARLNRIEFRLTSIMGSLNDQ